MSLHPSIPPDVCRARVLAALAVSPLPLTFDEIRERAWGLRTAPLAELADAVGVLLAGGLIRSHVVPVRVGRAVHRAVVYAPAASGAREGVRHG